MAKVTGPLLSATAHGSIGPRLTYSKRTNCQQVRIQKKQSDIQSQLRLAQRLKFSISISWWHMMSLEDQNIFINYTKGNQ